MREVVDYCLNKFLGVKYRFGKKMIYGINTKFLPQFSIVNYKASNVIKIGDGCILGVKIISEGEATFFKFGNNVYIGKSQIICRSGIEFEDNIMVAWGVTFYDHDSHSLEYGLRQQDLQQQLEDYANFKGNFLKNKNWEVVKTKPIKVCKNSWIGMNATILKGVTIGEGAIVAACSVVTKDVPPFSVVAGNPATVVKNI